MLRALAYANLAAALLTLIALRTGDLPFAAFLLAVFAAEAGSAAALRWLLPGTPWVRLDAWWRCVLCWPQPVICRSWSVA